MEGMLSAMAGIGTVASSLPLLLASALLTVPGQRSCDISTMSSCTARNHVKACPFASPMFTWDDLVVQADHSREVSAKVL